MESHLSFASDVGTEMVTLYVGPVSEQFVVHKNLLMTKSSYFRGALATPMFKEAKDGVFTFDEDDPGAFRLLIAWLYQGEGGRIPRVQRFLRPPGFSNHRSPEQPGSAPQASPHPQPNAFVEFDMPDSSTTGHKLRFPNRLVSLDATEPLSIEEIRLAHYDSNARREEDIISKFADLTVVQVDGQANVSYDRGSPSTISSQFASTFGLAKASQSKNGKSPTAKSNRKRMSTMEKNEPALFEEILDYQLTVLKLIILAERLCWYELFNEAMDTFLDGEEQLMQRLHVPPEFIDLAYTECYEKSPVRRLIADMVHYAITTHLTYPRYVGNAMNHEDFLTDLLQRLCHGSGKDTFSATRDPVKILRCNYHIHEERTGICRW